jgi:phosphoribosylamine--glycine ligase
MKVLLVGGGGREHAIAEALARSGAELHAFLKNRNPGIVRAARTHHLGVETDVDAAVERAKSCAASLVVIGPEAPLAVGLADRLEAEGLMVMGPTKGAARIETSKRFARELLDRHRVPGRIGWASCSTRSEALDAVRKFGGRVAVKPVGLTGGKGVKVSGDHLAGEEEAVDYAAEVIGSRVGGAAEVVVEEKLEGEEFSLQAFASGRELAGMPLAQDHKRLLDGDRGPNTGGMGSYTDADHTLPFVEPGEVDAALDSMRATLAALHEEGFPFRGILYGQFMLTRTGPKIVEFNARFADPESMNVLTLLESDAADAFERVAAGRLAGFAPKFAQDATVCRYIVPEGYGSKPLAGEPLEVDEQGIRKDGNVLYYAAVEEREGRIVTGTSRAVAVVGRGATLDEAESRCAASMGRVQGRVFYRTDIGTASLVGKRVEHMRRVRSGA